MLALHAEGSRGDRLTQTLDTSPPPTDHWLRRHAAKIVASLIIGGGFVWMMRKGGLPLLPDRSAFASVKWWVVAPYAVSVVISLVLRTYRWLYLLRPIADVSVRRVMGVGLIGVTAVLVAPLRMGEVVRPYMIAERGRLPFTAAMGTIGAERVIDGLVLSLFLFVGLSLSHPLSPLPDHLGKLPLPVAAVPASAYAALIVFACAFVAMALFYWRRELARKATYAILGIVSKRLATWFTSQVEKVTDGLRFLPDTQHSLPFFRDTVAFWLANAVGIWMLLWACGVQASFPEACVVMGVLGVGILMPAGPGFFGAFQLSSYSALAMYFSEDLVLGPGAAFVFLHYVLQVVISVAGAGVGARMIAERSEPTPSPVRDERAA